MINAGNIIGELMKGGLNSAGGARLENALGPKGLGQSGIGDVLGGLFGGGGQGGSGGGLGDMLGKALGGGQQQGGGLGGALGNMFGGGGQQGGGLGGMLGSVLGGGRSEGLGTAAIGGVLGSLFGGGSGAGGVAKGGAMAVLGMLAVNALKGYMTDKAKDPAQRANMQLMAGLREPENEQEQQQLQDLGMLTIRAMINAAKSDGEIDQDEMSKIVGRLQESGADETEMNYIREMLAAPMETDAIIGEVTDPQVAAQIYTASLLAIQVDTDQEREYIAQLGSRMELPQDALDEIHGMLGMA
jgi:uncharacterized membrane protein YebE (DUF533 family)